MLRGAYELHRTVANTSSASTAGGPLTDGKITLEFAECIGACDGAPACLKDDIHVMNVTTDAADRLITERKLK